MPAHTLALQYGDHRLVNVAMLGGLLALCQVVSLETVEEALRRQLPERHRHLLEGNVHALYAGAQWAMAQATGVPGRVQIQ
jgi:Pyruvate/2-oxoacid:ferredoxin oxidoreductase gamma subunit